MSSQFPKIPTIIAKNYVIGQDFDVMKRNSMEKFEKNVYKFGHGDRFIPLRSEVKSSFLKASNEEDFDISLSENNLRIMKKVQYQNQIRKIFNDEQETKEKYEKNSQGNKSLLHLDWECKLINIREKFFPDFETIEKKTFNRIENYIWSSKQIIASSSNRKVCLYHPLNGFTRALDICDRVCLTFSNDGEFLAMAYRKSRRNIDQHDLYVFHIQNDTLFNCEKLHTEKIRSTIEHDITAMCYTQNDNFLMCGTKVGKIYVLECRSIGQFSEKKSHNWTLHKSLATSHENEISKISFSANFRYMATLDIYGEFKIWNGGSWTYIFSYQKERSRLYKHFEWHPYIENELIIGREYYPALFLFNVTQRKIVASFLNWKENWELTSIAFNPKTAQLAVCFYNEEDYINRVSILASMSQVISSFDFDYIEGGLKLFWNSLGTMLGAGAQSFRFAFWSFYKNRDFHLQVANKSAKTSRKFKFLTLGDSKLSCLR